MKSTRPAAGASGPGSFARTPPFSTAQLRTAPAAAGIPHTVRIEKQRPQLLRGRHARRSYVGPSSKPGAVRPGPQLGIRRTRHLGRPGMPGGFPGKPVQWHAELGESGTRAPSPHARRSELGQKRSMLLQRSWLWRRVLLHAPGRELTTIFPQVTTTGFRPSAFSAAPRLLSAMIPTTAAAARIRVVTSPISRTGAPPMTRPVPGTTGFLQSRYARLALRRNNSKVLRSRTATLQPSFSDPVTLETRPPVTGVTLRNSES